MHPSSSGCGVKDLEIHYVRNFSALKLSDADFVKVTYTDEESGKVVRRETNTMPQWAGSCWYN